MTMPLRVDVDDLLVEVRAVVQASVHGWLFDAVDGVGRHLTFGCSAPYGRWLYDDLVSEGPFPLMITAGQVLT